MTDQLLCSVDIQKDENQSGAGQGLTVGSIFNLNCKGELPSDFHLDKAEIQLPETQKYTLKLLNAKSLNPSEQNLQVTSYVVGKHKISEAILSNSGHQLKISPIEFSVQTVIQVTDGQQPEPYGPRGPIFISVPLIYWLLLIFAILLLSGFFSRKYFIRRKRKKLLAMMEIQSQVQKPSVQFYSTLRKLQRQASFLYQLEDKKNSDQKEQFITELDKAFKFFIARVFRVPTAYWGRRRVLATIRDENFEIFKKIIGEDLEKSYIELQRAGKSALDLSVKDCAQLIELTRSTVDKIAKEMKA